MIVILLSHYEKSFSTCWCCRYCCCGCVRIDDVHAPVIELAVVVAVIDVAAVVVVPVAVKVEA